MKHTTTSLLLLLSIVVQAFTLYAFVVQKGLYMRSMASLGVCEVHLDRAVRVMTKKQQWAFKRKLEAYHD